MERLEAASAQLSNICFVGTPPLGINFLAKSKNLLSVEEVEPEEVAHFAPLSAHELRNRDPRKIQPRTLRSNPRSNNTVITATLAIIRSLTASAIQTAVDFRLTIFELLL